MDHIGPCQLEDGKRYIIVALDLFSKYAEAKVVKSQSAAETMDFLLDVFHRHGCPSSVLADNATGFLAASVRDAFAKLGIQGKHSTPYNPQGNGQVERLNKTLKDC